MKLTEREKWIAESAFDYGSRGETLSKTEREDLFSVCAKAKEKFERSKKKGRG